MDKDHRPVGYYDPVIEAARRVTNPAAAGTEPMSEADPLLRHAHSSPPQPPSPSPTVAADGGSANPQRSTPVTASITPRPVPAIHRGTGEGNTVVLNSTNGRGALPPHGGSRQHRSRFESVLDFLGDWSQYIIVIGAASGGLYFFRNEFPSPTELYLRLIARYVERVGSVEGTAHLQHLLSTFRSSRLQATHRPQTLPPFIVAATSELLYSTWKYNAPLRAAILALSPIAARQVLGLIRLSAFNVGSWVRQLRSPPVSVGTGGRRTTTPPAENGSIVTEKDNTRTKCTPTSRRRWLTRDALRAAISLGICFSGIALVTGTGALLYQAARYIPQLPPNGRLYLDLGHFGGSVVEPAPSLGKPAATAPPLTTARGSAASGATSSQIPVVAAAPSTPLPMSTLLLKALPRVPAAFPEVVALSCIHAPTLLRPVRKLLRDLRHTVQDALRPPPPQAQSTHLQEVASQGHRVAADGESNPQAQPTASAPSGLTSRDISLQQTFDEAGDSQ
jgi:hypothetical protein